MELQRGFGGHLAVVGQPPPKPAVDGDVLLAVVPRPDYLSHLRGGSPMRAARRWGRRSAPVQHQYHPDPDTGIGRWSLAAFTRAMRKGVSRDGHLRILPSPIRISRGCRTRTSRTCMRT